MPLRESRPASTLTLSTLLPDLDIKHSCSTVLSYCQNLRPDLTDIPWPDMVFFTDGSSFMQGRTRYAGAAVAAPDSVVCASALPPRTSAHKAELIALTQDLKMTKGKITNVHTDSQYTIATANALGLTAERETIENKDEILALAEALRLPLRVAIVHCPGHQRAWRRG